jgi:hypothetical protein
VSYYNLLISECAFMDVARACSLDTSVMSRYCGQAMQAVGELDERVTALLRQRRSKG